MNNAWEWTERDNLLLWVLPTFFNVREAWGNPYKMHPLLILGLDKFGMSLPKGCWIKIHCGYKEVGYKPNSFHYVARAVDFHVVGCSFLEAESHMMKFLRNPVLLEEGKEEQLINFIGLGIYPEWLNPGFHWDIRGKRASWAKIEGEYVAYEFGLEKAKELKL